MKRQDLYVIFSQAKPKKAKLVDKDWDQAKQVFYNQLVAYFSSPQGQQAIQRGPYWFHHYQPEELAALLVSEFDSFREMERRGSKQP